MRELKIPRSKIVIMTKCAFAVGEDETVLGHGFPDMLLQSKDYVNQGGEFIPFSFEIVTSCSIADSSLDQRFKSNRHNQMRR